MDEQVDKRIKLILKDVITNHSDYEINPLYLEIYDDYDDIFQKIFAYFHDKMNILFEFMNTKSGVNSHFNAAESRDLLMIINELRSLKKGLQKSEYDFEINESYIKRINYVKSFLENSGGSTIPEDYEEFDVLKYEPIFSLKNKKINLKFSNKTITTHTSFESDSITIQINDDILKHVRTLLETEHYFNAVEESYKIVRNKLKTITGKEKAHEAFKEDNYKLIFGHRAKDEAEADFYEGVKFLHMAIQKLRNEKAHTPANKIDKNLAMHYIVLASLSYELISRNIHER